MSREQTLQAFLDELASANPTPGGGSVAALTGAAGAALVSMICNLTIGREKFVAVEGEMKEILTKSENLRARLMEMMAKDIEAFNAVMAAYRMSKNNPEEKAARNVAIQAGFKKATLVPLETVRACAEVIDLGRTAIEIGNPNAICDAGTAVLCTQAGLKSAALNVLVNLGMIKDEAFVTKHRAELDKILAGHDELANEFYELAKNKSQD